MGMHLAHNIKILKNKSKKIFLRPDKELNHLAAILHVYAGGLNLMK